MKKIILIMFLVFISSNLFAQINGENYSAIPDIVTSTTPDGENLSSVIDTKGKKCFTITVPSSYDGTALRIYSGGTADSTTYLPVYDADDNILEITVTAGRKYYLEASKNYHFEQYVSFYNPTGATGDDSFISTWGKYKEQ